MGTLFRAALRYRLLHVLYWAYVIVAELHDMQVRRPQPEFAVVNYLDVFAGTAFRMLSVYVCVLLWLPRYLADGSLLRFIGLCSLTVLASGLLSLLVQIGYVPIIMGADISRGLSTAPITFLAKSVDIASSTALFLIVILIRHFYLKDRRNERIEKERILSELELLKAQVNPHFLFNALNSIYVLMKEDLPQAERTLLKFSSLLRYQLYDCGTDDTSLEKEVVFLRDYVALEQVRSGDALAITFTAPQPVPHRRIAPFLLMPFVENAFKHVSRSMRGQDRVDLNISMDGETLRLDVRNTVDTTASPMPGTPHGIGLRNVKRRLDLLYPGNHQLHIEHDPAHFSVTLELHTDGPALPRDRR